MNQNFKTTLLLATLMAFLIFVGGLFGSLFGLGRLGLIIGFVVGVVTNFYSYYNSDKIALKAARAQIVTEQQSPNLHRIVADLANSAGIKKPRVAITPDNTPNAFATGRNQDNAVVAVTKGLLSMLNEQELRGVLGHELGHIRNHDILISSVAATIAGLIVTLAHMAYYASFFSNRRDASDIITSLALSLLTPIAASVIQMAISRSREYKADAAGAQISHNPLALASALKKIEASTFQQPMDVKETTAHMYIINPFGNLKKSFGSLFSTHPSTAERIQRLNEMAQTGKY